MCIELLASAGVEERLRMAGVPRCGAPRCGKSGWCSSTGRPSPTCRFASKVCPREYLQLDWGEIRHFPFTQQPTGRRYFLACRLKYSRWVWVRFTTDMRQETLFCSLVDCFGALAFVPWVLVFDNMKTVTIGRDDQEQPIWHRSLLQLAAEFDFHPVACWPEAGNQKGSVESLVKFVKTNFLVGRTFIDDADLEAQCMKWQTRSQATDFTPLARFVEKSRKAARCRSLRATTASLSPARSAAARWWPCASASSSGDTRSSWPATSAPDGAHRRAIEPVHFAPLFGRKPRGQVMLYREVLLELGDVARSYLSELSHRQRNRLGDEVLEVYALVRRRARCRRNHPATAHRRRCP